MMREREHNSIINEIDTINIDPGVYVSQDEIRVKVELSKQVPRIVTKQVPREVQTPYTVLVPEHLYDI